jgi:predicted nucleic acid-binding protein
MILVDAGPLIALIHEDDNEHGRCREAFVAMNEPLGTCGAAVAEAMHLLSFSWRAQDALWEMIDSGAVQILSLGTEDIPRMRELMRKYEICRWIW